MRHLLKRYVFLLARLAGSTLWGATNAFGFDSAHRIQYSGNEEPCNVEVTFRHAKTELPDLTADKEENSEISENHSQRTEHIVLAKKTCDPRSNRNHRNAVRRNRS